MKGRPDELKDFVQLYTAMAQDLSDDVYMVVRPKSGRAELLAPAVRAAISRVDKDQLVSVRDIRTFEDIEWTATGRHRFRAVMVVAFAVLALVLAMVGVFGILAYSVQQHVRDFGVRRALGATTNDILRLVVGSAARVVLAGVVIGLALAIAGGRLIESMLFGVRPIDPATFVLVAVTLGAAAALSVAGPAWRAARINPARGAQEQLTGTEQPADPRRAPNRERQERQKNQEPAPSTQHRAPSTSTEHPAPSTQHRAPSTEHSAPSTTH